MASHVRKINIPPEVWEKTNLTQIKSSIPPPPLSKVKSNG